MCGLNKKYEIALVNLETYYSFPNVEDTNNHFSYSPDGGGIWYHILIPEANYDIEDIDGVIQQKIKQNGHAANVTISANTSTLKAVLILAWDAMLKRTGVTLELLLTNVNMLLMFKNGIRGGVDTASNRLGQANNRYMGEDYHSSKPSKYIIYLDANNLYGWAMSKPLATHGSSG